MPEKKTMERAREDKREGREIVELAADIERLFEMIEPGRHHACHRAEGDERRRKLGDARLQREHPAVDACQRRAEAAVVSIEYGGGFRHNHRAASTAVLPR